MPSVVYILTPLLVVAIMILGQKALAAAWRRRDHGPDANLESRPRPSARPWTRRGAASRQRTASVIAAVNGVVVEPAVAMNGAAVEPAAGRPMPVNGHRADPAVDGGAAEPEVPAPRPTEGARRAATAPPTGDEHSPGRERTAMESDRMADEAIVRAALEELRRSGRQPVDRPAQARPSASPTRQTRDGGAAYRIGNMLYERGHFEGAAVAWRLAAAKRHAKAATRLGMMREERGDTGGARRAYKKAGRLGDPTAAERSAALTRSRRT